MQGAGSWARKGTDLGARSGTDYLHETVVQGQSLMSRRQRREGRGGEEKGGGADLDDCRIELAALDKLVIGQLGVLVLVHVLEDLVHSLDDRLPPRVSRISRLRQRKGPDRTFSGVFSSSGSWTI
jgi:hypothetical protein